MSCGQQFSAKERLQHDAHPPHQCLESSSCAAVGKNPFN